jgi:CheY-like chemotaxis protein
MQQELLQAQKMEAVGHLASGIAHDFNNMLGAILGFSELLWRKLDRESPLRGYADRITVIARRGSELTKQMLAFARKGKYRNVPVDIHGLLSEIIFMLEHTLGKRIKIRLTRDALYSTTQGDPSQLQNMIINLAINARDAMPEGGVLTVATETVHIDNPADVRPFGGFEVKKGDYCVLHIEDSGTGIPPENLPHIFEPFFTSRPRGRGTGLGLASVYGCVKNHHGFIVVDNRVGEGVAFRIHLPLVSTPRRPATRSIKVHNPDQKRIAHVRIQAMLVDDEQDVLDGLCDGLRALGWTVYPFVCGAEAVAFYRERYIDIDVVVLDMIMPDMSGRKVFAALKEIDPDLIAILASGYARGSDAEELLGAGAAAYLEKPFSASDLAQSAENALLEKWQGQSQP